MTAAIRYMIMSQLGSGLFLIGLSILYDVTGHLLMSPAKESVELLTASGNYRLPMLVIMAVISVGLHRGKRSRRFGGYAFGTEGGCADLRRHWRGRTGGAGRSRD